MSKFERESRYIVFKVKDFERVSTSTERGIVEILASRIDEDRIRRGKIPLSCVVVEEDWPEYETTWNAIQARIEGNVRPQTRVDQGPPVPSVEDLAKWISMALGHVLPMYDTVTHGDLFVAKVVHRHLLTHGYQSPGYSGEQMREFGKAVYDWAFAESTPIGQLFDFMDEYLATLTPEGENSK